MEEKKYLNEEEYQQKAKKLKSIGKIVLVIGILMLVLGIVFLVLGFSGFGKTGIDAVSSSRLNSGQFTKGIFSGFGLFALGGLLNTFGLFVTGIGVMILFMAHRREIVAFTTKQVMPVAKEGINEITPTIGNAMENFAEHISKGIKKGLKDEDNKE